MFLPPINKSILPTLQHYNKKIIRGEKAGELRARINQIALKDRRQTNILNKYILESFMKENNNV